MLSQSDIERIDQAAKALLEDPGVKVDDGEITERLLACGAKTGLEAQVVRFPRSMVNEYLRLAPVRIRLADRAGKTWDVGPDTPSTFWTAAALFYLDQHSFRPISQNDLADFSRVVETLPNVDTIVGTAIEDTPPAQRDFVGFRIMAANTRKHLRPLSFTPKGGEAMIEMAKVLAGGRTPKDCPLFSVGFTAHGPLRWTALALGVFKATSGHGIACTVNGEPMAGATAPVTLAGTCAVGTAEILSGIVINQILEPGRPCFFNLGFAHVMDMRSGFAVTGGPENALLAAAGADLARHYRVPSVSWMCTDSLYYDAQNALEKTLAALTHAQARVSAVWGVGSVESEKTISPVQAVIDDEIIGMVRRYLAGFETDEESIALREIRQIGISGHFMASEHTLAHYRESILMPRLLVRTQRSAPGEDDQLVPRAEKTVNKILSADREPILAPETERELLRIEKRYATMLG